MKSQTRSMILAVMMMAVMVASSVMVTDLSDATTSGTCDLVVYTDPEESYITITADSVDSGVSDVTATTNSSGVAVLSLSCSTMWYVYGDQVGSLVSELRTFDPDTSDTTYSLTLEYVERFVYTLTFDSSAFSSDPDNALTYADDASGFSAITSWGSNALIDYCYYGVFDSSGSLIGKLNPNNLTLFLDGSSAASYITTCNVMFCIPTLYISSTSTSLTISNDHTVGTAYAHTIDDYIYEFYGIGVYEGSVSDGKLMSVSGATPTTSTTRATFRTYAAANTVDNGLALQWNFYQYQVYKYIVLFAGESFDSQGTFGNGNVGGSSSTTTGMCNTYGMFYGSTSSTTTAVKCYIENAWGSVWEFTDDCVASGYVIYAGQNSSVSDDTGSMDSLVTIGSSGYPGTISTGDSTFGIGTATGGSSSTCTFDYQYSGSSTYCLLVGGFWNNGSSAGVSGLFADASLSGSGSDVGSRLAYVYDADAASVVTSATVTFEPNNGNDPTVVVVDAGDTIGTWPDDPVYTGHVFSGWYTDSACTTLFATSTAITYDMTLYAGYDTELVFTTTPTASATVTQSSVYDNAIVFSAAGSTGISSILWNFGDGTTATSLYAVHIYASSGTYDYTLTVTNDYGSDVYSGTVTASEVPDDTASESSGSSTASTLITAAEWIVGIIAVILLFKFVILRMI